MTCFLWLVNIDIKTTSIKFFDICPNNSNLSENRLSYKVLEIIEFASDLLFPLAIAAPIKSGILWSSSSLQKSQIKLLKMIANPWKTSLKEIV